MARTAEKPRGPGRPALPAAKAKSLRVSVALTERELTQLRASAARAGVSVSEYLRARAK